MKQKIARILSLSLSLSWSLCLGGFALSASAQTTLIAPGSTWKYLDDGTDQGTAWRATGFNDTAWPSGPAQLGYGDGDEATVLGFGGDPQNRFVTYYFRHGFQVNNPGAFVVSTMRVRRDDGVIVYLNGTEVFRNNMPAGDVDFTTLGFNAGDDGNTVFTFNVPTSLLLSGQNVVAAEIHQSSLGSSDISFELEFTASTENNRPAVALLNPGANAFFTAPADITITASASDSDGGVALVEFFQGATKLGEDASSPYGMNWSGVPVGNYALRAIATDNLGARGTSAVVNVTVGVSTPPTVASKVPAAGNISSLSIITVNFSEAVTGVDASDLLVNGVPAKSVTGGGTSYQFTVAQPAEGTVYVGWNGAHGIADFENPPKAFDPAGAGASWQYNLVDTVAPTVVQLDPPANATVRELNSIEVRFSEPVAGVDAADLRINGAPATSVSGRGDGPYAFGFPTPANGVVSLSWAGGHGITDLATARNAFAGGAWTYTLNTNAVWESQLVIHEIMYHPASERVADEWIELRNRGGAPVNLTGWRLNRAIDFVFPNVTVPAGGYVVVAADVAAFNAKYPGVANVVGGWTGRLSNSRDEVELEDPSGNQVDLVVYADEGDWARRTASGVGWQWVSPADGLGSSLELRQSALPNDNGQNWASSNTPEGTPGQANSVASGNLAPLIYDVTHLPAVPRSTNAVTVLARVVDESASGLTVRLWRRDAATTDAFASVAMLDNGLSNDGAAGDGVYGVVLPAMPNGRITEFYVEAVDAGSNARTWPAPADVGGGSFAQQANALFQVDDEAYAGKQAIYRMILRPQDRNDLIGGFDRVQRNATLVTIEGSDVQIRYLCETRRRGASSFGATPPTLKFNIPRDRPWNDKTSMNLNSVNVHAQVLGSAVSLKAGLPAPYARAVQLRFNGVNEAPGGGGMFGSYAHVEVVDGEWARDHFPEDGNGNVYSKRRPTCDALGYLGSDPQGYINCAYDKESNASENDWTDLMNLTFAMDYDTTADNDYVQAVRRNLNVELGLRYFAVLFLMNYTETALGNGDDDDYDLYRGIVDPRFMFLPHDFDSIFGSAGSLSDNLFVAATPWNPNIGRFLLNPEFEQLYYAEYRRQLAGMFSTNSLFPLMDQVLGDWVPAPTIQSMKNNALSRINYVRSALPASTTVRATISGEPDSPTYLNSATLNVGGTDVTHYRYRLNGGAWSTERAVSQPISLTSLANGNYTVYVVGRDGAGNWQADANATVSKTWTVISSLRGVVINEVLARNDSAVPHEGTFPDYIELFNAGTTTIDLSGLRLTDDLDDPSRYTFPAGTTLAAGAYRVVYANNPDGTSGIHIGFGLGQDGDSVYLLDRATNGTRVVDSVRFGWQLSNLSIGRLGNGQWGLATPTEGTANVGAATGPVTGLRINEWLANPIAPLQDFVEIYNTNSLPVNLGGLYLTDHPIGQPLRDDITPLSFIDAYGYRAFIADGNPGSDHLNFSLSQEGGEIALISAQGAVIDCVIYGNQFAGISQGRSPNGGSRIVYFDIPTPGAGNPTAPGPVEPQLVNLIPLNDVFLWKYEDTGADLGTAWRATGFNDGSWPSGPGLLAFEVDGLPEPIRTPLAWQTGKITYYFRARFNLPSNLNISAIQMTHVIDDGAVFYLNGQEVGRYNMPVGEVNFQSLAGPSSVGNATYQGPYDLPLGSFVTGENVLAVEVHQNSPSSSDIVFGLRLDAVILNTDPGSAGIRINEILANANVVTNSDGTISDWVELYNPANASVDLSGMSFTDQLANPRRWVFPTGSVIGAGGYRVVRFDSESLATTNPATILNTGFGMKAAGDSLYLFNRPQGGGELLDAVTFGIQAPDWSIGRVPSGGSNWVLNLPSPGGVNIAASLGNPALLKINEWMAAPASGGDWFEIHNPSAQPVSLSGLHLTDDLNNRLQYPPIPALSFIASGLSGFLKIIADNDPTAGADHVPFALGRTGESLGICDKFGTLIDHYTFGAQGTGISQGRLPDGSTNVIFFPESASPAESNFLPIPNVVINEVLSHTDPPLEDAIELRNTSASPVNISGWYMSDSATALRKYRIPNNTTIPANGFKVFYEYQFNPIPNDPGSFDLSSALGDDVYLSAVDGQGQLNGYRAKVSFGPAANGVSFGRHVTSALNGSKPEFVAMAQRTFGNDNPPSLNDFRAGTGLANSGPKVGPVVISEIMYHPPDLTGGLDNLTDEYIELQNITAAPVALYDPAAPTNTWKLKDAVSFDFPRNLTLSGGGILLVVGFNPSDAALSNAFRAKFNLQAGAILLGPYSGKLDNSTDSVELARPDSPETSGPLAGLVPYILVDKVKYFDLAPWPTGPDGTGQSLTRVTPGNFGNDPVNWTAATPTPGPQGPSQDTDGDGMPNSWETQYGLNPNVNDANGDLDGDGMRNLDEYLAGTAPNSAASVLRLTVSPGAPVLLRFNAAANLTYTVESKNALIPGAWSTLQTVPAGAAREVQITDSNPGQTRFYRVRAP